MPSRTLVSLTLVAALVVSAAPGCGEDSEDGSDSDAGPSAPTRTTVPDDGGGAIPDLPDNDDPAAVQCTGPPRGVFDATAIVGESLDLAERSARVEGCSIRVVERDGKPLAVTDDFRPDRVNVVVEDGEVTRIVSLG